jgi:hypothetical protein
VHNPLHNPLIKLPVFNTIGLFVRNPLLWQPQRGQPRGSRISWVLTFQFIISLSIFLRNNWFEIKEAWGKVHKTRRWTLWGTFCRMTEWHSKSLATVINCACEMLFSLVIIFLPNFVLIIVRFSFMYVCVWCRRLELQHGWWTRSSAVWTRVRTNELCIGCTFVCSLCDIDPWNGLVCSLTPALSKYSICVLVVAINTHELIRSINWLPVVVVKVLVVV